jgi:UDP-glucose 4-epimerase
MKIFISGGAGFIGHHCATRFLESSQFNVEQVTIYDNFTSGQWSYLSEIKNNPKLKIVDGDIKHLGELTHAMSGHDVVFHYAANPDIAKAVKQPDIDFWEGTYLTQNILEAMRINKVKFILYTSGSGVYGEKAEEVFKEDFGPCFPISTYGASKFACEALISSYAHMFGLKGRAFRFANVVGPRQTHGVGYDFVRRLQKKTHELSILGDGTQTKSYIHVNDVLNSMFLVFETLLQEQSQPFDVYNVATDDTITVTEIGKLSCEIVGLQPEKVTFHYSGGDRGWKGDVPKILLNADKIKKLGWKCHLNSYEALKLSMNHMWKEINS